MDLDHIKGGPSSPPDLTFAYPDYQAVDFAPWDSDSVAFTRFPFSAASDSPQDAAALDYNKTSLSTTSPFSITSPSSDWLPSLPRLTTTYGDALTSPSTWAAETGSESGDYADLFTPIDDSMQLDMSSPKWSWSQPSSPSLDAKLPLPVPDNSKPSAATPAAAAAAAAAKPRTRASVSASLKRQRRSSARSGSGGGATASSPSDNADGDELRVRRNHNLVEKQYRNRLNAQFDRLLSVLPLEERQLVSGGGRRKGSGGADGGGGGGGPDDKRLSKAEVLDAATRRIQDLEMERRQLMRDKRDLIRNIHLMNPSMVADMVPLAI